MYKDCDIDTIRSKMSIIIMIVIILVELILVFMPEKYHYSYQGVIISKKPVEEHFYTEHDKMMYVYIDYTTNDTMSIIQDDRFHSGYYTQRTNERHVYTYNWILSSIVWFFPSLICLIFLAIMHAD